MAARPYRTVELHDRRSLDFLIFHFVPPYVFRHKQSDDTGEGKQRKGKPKSDTAAVPRLRTRNLLCPFAAVAAGFRHAAVPSGDDGRRDKVIALNETAEHGGCLCAALRPLGARIPSSCTFRIPLPTIQPMAGSAQEDTCPASVKPDRSLAADTS